MRSILFGLMVLVAALGSPTQITAEGPMSDCTCLAQASIAVIGDEASYKSEDEYVEYLWRDLQASMTQRAKAVEQTGMEPVSVHVGHLNCRRLPKLSVTGFGPYSTHNHVVIGCGVRVDLCWSIR